MSIVALLLLSASISYLVSEAILSLIYGLIVGLIPSAANFL